MQSCSDRSTNNEATDDLRGKVTVSPEKFKELMEEHDAIIVDVRTPEETALGAISGASFINFYDPSFEDKIQLIPREKSIFVYCRSGGRSSKAAQMFSEKGFNRVFDLKGGIGAWEGAGYELTTPLVEGEHVETISLSDFERTLAGEGVVLVDFHTRWCAPCKKMEPIIDALQMDFKGRALVLKIDVDQNKAIAKAYDVFAVPTVVLFKGGERLWTHDGFADEDQLRGKLTQALEADM